MARDKSVREILTIILSASALLGGHAANAAVVDIQRKFPQISPFNPNCSASNQLNAKDQPIGPRAPNAPYMTQCEAQERVKRADDASNDFDYDLINFYKKKIFQYPDMEPLFTKYQSEIMEKNHWHERVKDPAITERANATLDAEVWYETNKLTMEKPPAGNDAPIKDCLHKWDQLLNKYREKKIVRSDHPAHDDRKVQEAEEYLTWMKQIRQDGQNLVCKGPDGKGRLSRMLEVTVEEAEEIIED